MLIGGKDRFTPEKIEDRSPANTDVVLGIFQKGGEQDAIDALAAARKAFPAWSRMKWQDRVALMRKAADLINERIFMISAALSMEVGKNRMESLGDVAETADLIRYYCDEMERNNGYVVEMGRDPLVGYSATNISVMRPYGTWLVISPFNFPASLTGGPAGAALVTGNTVVMKPASDTPWVVRLIAECLRDAGLPDGVVQLRHRTWQHPRAGADHLLGCGWRHLHRLVWGWDGYLPRLLQLLLRPSDHPGAGW